VQSFGEHEAEIAAQSSGKNNTSRFAMSNDYVNKGQHNETSSQFND
jgi:hypothetical protein